MLCLFATISEISARWRTSFCGLLATIPSYGFADEPVEELVIQAPITSATTTTVTLRNVQQQLSPSGELPELLSSVPGLHISSLGGFGDWSTVSVRGASLRQVLIAIDGVPLNPDGNSVINLAELPVTAFQEVEIWRGGAPPRFGAAPLGGVINLISDASGPPSLSATGGSYEIARFSAGQQVKWTDSIFSGFINAFTTAGDFRYFSDNATPYRRTDDQRELRNNNDKRQVFSLLRFQHLHGPIRISILDTPLFRNEGLPGPSEASTTHVRFETTRNLAVLQFDAGNSKLLGMGRLWHHWRQEQLDDPLGELGTIRREQRDQFQTIGALSEFRTSIASIWQPAVTLEGRWEEFQTQHSQQTVSNRQRLTAIGSIASPIIFNKFRFEPVMQLSFRNDRGLGMAEQIGQAPVEWKQRTSIVPTAHLGVRWRLPYGWSLQSHGGRFHRAPDLMELFGNQGATRGNVELRPESGWHVDAMAHHQIDQPWGRISTEAGLFLVSTRDAIVYVQNSQHTLYPINLGKTWIQGLEVGIEGELGERVEFGAALTGTQSVNLTHEPIVVNKQLPRIPTWELDTKLGVRPIPRIRIGYHFHYTSSFAWDTPNWNRAPRRSLHGVSVAVRIPKGPELAIDIQNLGNTIAEVVPRNPLDRNDPSRVVVPVTDVVGYPQPGRTLLITMRWEK